MGLVCHNPRCLPPSRAGRETVLGEDEHVTFYFDGDMCSPSL